MGKVEKFKSARGKIRTKEDIESFKGLKKDLKWYLGLNQIKTTTGGRKIMHILFKEFIEKSLSPLKENNKNNFTRNEISDIITKTIINYFK